MMIRSILILTLLLGGQGIAPVLAAPAAKPKVRPRIRWQPPIPPNLGDPGGRGQGGGSRGDCEEYYEGASAVLPPSQWGLTTLEYPTVWLNLPKGIKAQVPVEFVLKDAQGKVLFKEIADATQTPAGINPFPLPTRAPALQVNQQYSWSIAIYCDAAVPDKPVVIRGAIGRSALSSLAKTRLAQSLDAIDRATIYAEQGFWYDALTMLGMEQRSSGEAAIVWEDLLKQAN
ncbi:MAG: DUF928 domain-containing protein [Alkalinema sp. RU_4_3]|nr:DUF928 domain-containing protein [Alkalinema sp. RU_4_3]